ncbi:MAG: hypothetical protein HQL05_01420 [Nitrospirae bacterium]|uniref:hypothetical protein n=1 Tax=Candidatus Magnetobacterium casense TaxID=1455061 RepID=UPI00058D37CE|nr:hypothetical protein [Candidatus Magnetobacterium casensis]MBF0336469.1 hypothetical protein [Nitrospirota bacterium]
MFTVFLDTSALPAFFNKKDKNHTAAMEVMTVIKKQRTKMVSTNFIFDEALTLCLARTNHEIAVKMGEFVLRYPL